MPVTPEPAMPPAPTRSGLPLFGLYGEPVVPGQELLHIEEVRSRSRLYQWEIEPHVHRGLYQVLWVRRGEVDAVLDDWRGQRSGPVAIVVPPGVAHGFRFAPDTDGHVLTVGARFLVAGDFEEAGAAFLRLFATPGVLSLGGAVGVGEGESGGPGGWQADTAERLDALFAELAAEYSLPGQTDSPVVQWLARSLMWRLARAQAHDRVDVAQGPQRHRAQLARFLALVEAHFQSHWTLGQYASRLGLSTQRLNRLARAESGHPALEVVHERLTREACRRLLHTAVPATRLALDLGFEDPAYFSRFFRRRMGHSPQRWRQMQAASAPASAPAPGPEPGAGPSAAGTGSE